MQEPYKITYENFLNYKPSELIESSLNDLDMVLNDGLKINMSKWFGSYKQMDTAKKDECCVCLGGAVLYGKDLQIRDSIKRYRTDEAEHRLATNDKLTNIAFLFDDIRCYNKSAVISRIMKMYDVENCRQVIDDAINDKWIGEPFSSNMNDDRIFLLKKSVQSLAGALKSVGL